MSGCSCSDGVPPRRLTGADDFARLARFCRRNALAFDGRIELAVPALDAERRRALEARINRLWTSCGCGEAAAAALLALLAWWSDAIPLRAAFSESSVAVSVIVAAAWVFGAATLAKVAGVGLAHQRLARLLAREADRLR